MTGFVDGNRGLFRLVLICFGFVLDLLICFGFGRPSRYLHERRSFDCSWKYLDRPWHDSSRLDGLGVGQLADVVGSEREVLQVLEVRVVPQRQRMVVHDRLVPRTCRRVLLGFARSRDEKSNRDLNGILDILI